MTVVSTDRLSWGPLRSVSLELERGCHSLVGSPAETTALVGLLAGVHRPRRGTVRVENRDPHRSPEVRRRVGCVLEFEPPLAGRSVRAALTLELGSRRAVEPTLSVLGLGAWADRTTSGLSPAERQSIALAVALATPDPVLVVLWEPFTRTSGVSRTTLLECLAEVARNSCVVCATSSVRDALSVGGTAHVISGGEVVGNALALASEVAPGNVSDYIVRSERARELVSALAQRPEVVGVEWDGRTAPRVLHVRGRDGEAAPRAIVDAARTAGISIEYLSAEDPSLKLVQSASLDALRSARVTAARATLSPMTPSAVPTTPVASVPSGLTAAPSTLPGAAPTGVPLEGVAATWTRLEGVVTEATPLDGARSAAPTPPSTTSATPTGPDGGTPDGGES